MDTARKVLRTVRQESPLIVSGAPHIRSKRTVALWMWTRVLLLVPLAVFVASPAVVVNTVAASILFEALAEVLLRRPIKIFDGSAALVGMLLGLSIPAGAEWWMCWVAAFYAVFVARELSGGLGKYRFNPAVFGAVVFMGLFPKEPAVNVYFIFLAAILETVTLPLTLAGRVLFAGLVFAASSVAGPAFAVLFANFWVPAIDKYVKTKHQGPRMLMGDCN